MAGAKELPLRLFEQGFEPPTDRRVNNYYNLRWIEDLKLALDEEDVGKLYASQFNYLMQMGNHTCSVNFVHYLLSRQLVTNKNNEIWMLFSGKPIRYSLRDFALVTGLNCGKVGGRGVSKKLASKGKGKSVGHSSSTSLWKQLFGSEKRPDTKFIYNKLREGRKYKDSKTRFRLALLLIVYGILCPTANTTIIREEYVELLEDVDAFLEYPWGRKSYILTVNSAKAWDPYKFSKKTLVVQGFSHAILLVAVSAAPQIIKHPLITQCLEDENVLVEEVVRLIVELGLSIQTEQARQMDGDGLVAVRSCIADGISRLGDELEFLDDEADSRVDYMKELIRSGAVFDHNCWVGGVRWAEIDQMKEAKGDSVQEDVPPSGDGEDDSSQQRPRCLVCKKHAKGQPSSSALDPNMDANSSGIGPALKSFLETLFTTLTDDIATSSSAMMEGYNRSMKDYIDEVSEKNKQEILQILNHDGVKLRTSTADSNSQQRTPNVSAYSPLNDENVHMAVEDNNDGDAFSDYRSAEKDPRRGDVEDVIRSVCEDIAIAAVDRNEHAVEVASNTDFARYQTAPSQANADSEKQVMSAECQTIGDGDAGGTLTDISPPRFSLGLTQPHEESEHPTTGVEETNPAADSNLLSVNRNKPGLEIPVTAVSHNDQPPIVQETITDITGPIESSRPNDKPDVRRKTKEVAKRFARQRCRIGDNISKDSEDIELPHTMTKKVDVYGGGRRTSKRNRHSPDKFTPSGPTETKKIIAKRYAHKKPKKSIAISSYMGKFNPFMPTPKEDVDDFLNNVTRSVTFKLPDGLEVENMVFLRVFEGATFLNPREMDVLVKFLQIRRDLTPEIRYDFLPSAFLSTLKSHSPRFHKITHKESFMFTPDSVVGIRNRPLWYTAVDILYVPFAIQGRHWLGVVIDLLASTIHVLNCNGAKFSSIAVESFVQPLAELLPYFIKRQGYAGGTGVQTTEPFQVSVTNLPVVVTEEGLSAVASLVLMEQHAAGMITPAHLLTGDNLHCAAENYAIECFKAIESTAHWD